ncbi:hypothetical protein B0H13DRAFT_1732188 [Mycena leptocephala]|nr:hypothetical protein B0H13DRAFT_1732188 [Mycena leptocephala]
MPSLATAEASNGGFAPSYIPVAVFVGGTSGVGQAMAEALARQTNGRAHIILIGRNAVQAADILARFPKPAEGDADGWTHEFVACDATSVVSVRTVCGGLRARLKRINFLVISAAGPKANSLVECGETPEGLDNHLIFFALRVHEELLPLLVRAREMGQHAHLMTVLGAGLGVSIASEDLGLAEARRRSIKFLQGATVWFAAHHPDIAFTHIHPGQVSTPTASAMMGWFDAPLGWLLAPLGWLLTAC